MLQREFNFRALMLLKEDGKYRCATRDEVLEAAQWEIDALFRRGETICGPDAVKKYFRVQLAHYEHEIFAVLWLDNRHRVLGFERLFRGTIDGASVHPREVVKSALRHNAAACIFCHNHPSGITDPSRSDEVITRQLKDALALVEVRTMDHVIVGEHAYSFAEHGLL